MMYIFSVTNQIRHLNRAVENFQCTVKGNIYCHCVDYIGAKKKNFFKTASNCLKVIKECQYSLAVHMRL